MKVLVAQLGARMHYAVPRMLHEAGMLERLCTDICAVKGWPKYLSVLPERLRPKPLKRLLGRVPKGVPSKLITSFTAFGREYARKRGSAGSASESTAVHLWAGQSICEMILKQGLGQAKGVYTFNSAGLEVLRFARKQGLLGIMEQTIAPRIVEKELLDEEHRRYPGWEKPQELDGTFEAFVAREKAEWAEATIILCGSEFVKQGIARCEGPVKKCVVVPYGVDVNFRLNARRPKEKGPLRVLTVGALGLRKGTPYVLEAAKELRGEAEFRMVGAVGVSAEALAQLRQNVKVLGPIPRSEILEQYAWADVFFLPSVCEGSATVTYEALGCGLPVITTPNTGSIVRHEKEGFIIPVREVAAMVDSLRMLARDENLRENMSLQAKNLASSYTLQDYSQRLLTAIVNAREERV